MTTPVPPAAQSSNLSVSSASNDNNSKVRTILSMWKTPDRRELFADVSKTLEATAQHRELTQLSNGVEELRAKVSSLEQKNNKQDSSASDLRDRVVSLEGDGARSRSEEIFRQKQLESLVQQTDEARAAIAEHQAQLEYLTAQTKQWRESQLSPAQQKWWALLQWVYVPAISAVKGLWVVVFPAIETFRRLTLFGRSGNRSAQAESETDDDERAAVLAARQRSDGSNQNPGSLLNLLLAGALDPILKNGSK